MTVLKTVVLAEKPSVAATIANVLGANTRRQGYYEGPQYVVTYAFGHLVTIAEPELMNPSWGQAWTMQQIPMIPEQWRYSIADKAQDQFAIIKNLFLDPATATIINAADAGREGQLIFDLIYNMSGSRKPVKRLWTSSLTDEALRVAMSNLKPASDFVPLSQAAALRQQWDWINGLSATRAYTIINGQKCTAGRVQTPTLALIVDRQHAIDTFRPTPFFEIIATFEPSFTARYITADPEPQTRLQDKTAANAILASINPVPRGSVSSIVTEEKKTKPPALYDLLTLQKESNKRYGYTAQQTLDIAQSLYEEHKILSYPRTESRHLSTDMLTELPKLLAALPQQWSSHAQAAIGALATGFQLSKNYVDDAKLTDHHAIIPTQRTPPNDLPEKQSNIYQLVAARFLAIFMPPEIRSETTVIINLAGYSFRARGVVIKDRGWTLIEPAPTDDAKKQSDEDSQQLPQLTKDQLVPKITAELKEGKTTAPRLYDDSSLLTAMKTAGQDLDDQDLAVHMKQSGLGTPATRAATIEKLISTGYVDRKKKAIVPTDKGKAFINQVHPKLKDVALTASWEKQLHDIEDGTVTAQAADAAFIKFTKQIFPEIVASAPPPIPLASATGLGPCPKCKEGVVRKLTIGAIGAGCSRYKAGCKFMVWAEINGKKLTEEHIRQLVIHGRSNLIKGFKKKDGTGTYDARLALTDDFSIKLEFDSRGTNGKQAGKAK